MNVHIFRHQAGHWTPPLRWDLDGAQTLLLVFCAPRYEADPGPLHTLCEAFPTSVILGCSTAGEIQGDEVFDDTIVATAVQFEHTVLTRASAGVLRSEQSREAGRSVGSALAGPGLRAVFVLSDGSRVNGSELVEGLNEVLPPDVVVTGGLAGDGTAFGRTWVLENGRPTEGLVAAVGLCGERLRVAFGSKGGWDVFGPERAITRSEGNVLLELDGRPALDLYKDYLGDRAAELPASALLFPLSVRRGRDDANRVVRTVLSVDDQARSMTFAGNVPSGHLAQLMRANFDHLVDGAETAALAVQKQIETDPVLCIAVSCVGRRIVMGERVEEEVEAVLNCLPSSALQVGFYSYGELCPYPDGRCDLHNQTMTLTTIGET